MNKLFFKYKIWYLLVSFFVFIPACKKESVKEVLTGDTGLSSDLGTRKYSRPDGAGMDFCGKQFRIKMNDDTVMHMYGDFASDGSPKSIRSIYYEVPNSESKPLMLFNENGKVEFILFYTETDSLLSEYFRFEYFSDKIVHSIFQANWETEESAMKFEKNLNFDANGVITGGNTIQPYTEIPSGSYQNHTRLNELKNGLISSYNYSGLHADQLNHLTNVNQNVNNYLMSDMANISYYRISGLAKLIVGVAAVGYALAIKTGGLAWLEKQWKNINFQIIPDAQGSELDPYNPFKGMPDYKIIGTKLLTAGNWVGFAYYSLSSPGGKSCNFFQGCYEYVDAVAGCSVKNTYFMTVKNMGFQFKGDKRASLTLLLSGVEERVDPSTCVVTKSRNDDDESGLFNWIFNDKTNSISLADPIDPNDVEILSIVSLLPNRLTLKSEDGVIMHFAR